MTHPPALPPSSDVPSASSAVDDAIAVLRGRRIAVLTGAGVSTDSGIPDYRGEGAPKRTPMTMAQFLSDAAYRKRYWAGSHLGWPLFDAAGPNDGHRALAGLEAAGLVAGVVTQNVDGLHVQAGSARVVELHGSVDRVLCLDCGQMFARRSIVERIDALNPWLERPESVSINPDGDAEVRDPDRFVVPPCSVCGGTLKPDVVFFGEFVPPERFAEAKAIVGGAEAVLVAGTSLAVNSGVRLLEQARRRRIPIVVVNRGATKGDRFAAVRVEGGTTDVLTAIVRALAPGRARDEEAPR